MYAQVSGRCFIFIALLMLIFVLGRALIRLLDTLVFSYKDVFPARGSRMKVALTLLK